MKQQPSPTNDRAQAYTLEAIIAAVLVLGAITFALQATAVTPLTSSTSNERVQVQQQTTAEDSLEIAADSGTLTNTLLHWDTNNQSFIDGTRQGYVNQLPPTEFGQQLNNTFTLNNIGVNAYVISESPDSNSVSQKTLIDQGTPSSNAVVATQTIVLYNDTTLSDGSNRPLTDVENRLYIKNAHPNSNVYNVVTVKLVVWRM